MSDIEIIKKYGSIENYIYELEQENKQLKEAMAEIVKYKELDSCSTATQYMVKANVYKTYDTRIKQLKEVIAIKEKQLEEVKNNKTDYTKVNILEMKLDKYKEVIDQIREYIKNSSDMSVVNNYSFPDKPVIDKRSKKDLLQILDKVKEK